MQHRPDLGATLGQATVIVLHLREIAVASFDRRRSTLKGFGMLRCPRFPLLKDIGRHLRGDRVSVKRVLNSLQDL